MIASPEILADKVFDAPYVKRTKHRTLPACLANRVKKRRNRNRIAAASRRRNRR